jgi:hypothetical protein
MLPARTQYNIPTSNFSNLAMRGRSNITNQFGGVGGVPYGPARPPQVPGPPTGYGPGAFQQMAAPVVQTPYLSSERGAPGTLSSQYGTDDSWYRPAAPAGQVAAGIQPTPAGNTDYSQTQAAQNYAAAGTSFLNQMRWDPQAKKYVSIGRLLKQGKLDLKGNWRKQSKRQKMAKSIERRNQPAPVQQVQQQVEEKRRDYTLANSLITFNTASG